MMDEIICAACGRPNLAEAVKCWYCQEALEKQSGLKGEPVPQEPPANQEEQAQPEAEAQADNRETDLPEWLKRIRAMKEADLQKEEERSRWQQQVLFSGGASKTPDTASRRGSGKRRVQPPRQAEPEAPAPARDTPAQPPSPARGVKDGDKTELKVEDKESEIPTGGSSEDLPDGFVPLDRE